eukprot:Gb_22611 [translate_table: standard]
MAFPSSTMAGSLYGTSPEASRSVWPGEASCGIKVDGARLKIVPQRGKVSAERANGFQKDFPLPSNSSSNSSSGRFVFSDQWWRKPSSLPQPANLTSFWSDSRTPCTPTDGNESISPGDSMKEYPFHETPSSRGSHRGVPVYVMLPLNTVNMNGMLARRKAMNVSLMALKSAGVEGIMVDVWWGVVEKDNPGLYNWIGYLDLMEMARKQGLKVQAVMSFHQCGGNVGDSCWIPLPSWVHEEMDKNPDLGYTDREGRRNREYITLGCDTLPVLKGRSPSQVYSDFMRSFRDIFKDFLGETIVEIQLGMGPAGELRYPSYPESNQMWQFPGIGEFQCYDKSSLEGMILVQYMLASLKACADNVGNVEWGVTGPHDAGHYKMWPEETGFFSKEGSWNTPYGQFFLEWYSGMLLMHGERIATAAETIFHGTGAKLSGKVAGIHWHYCTRSHSAELTAGYYNTRTRDGYLPLAHMFGRHGVTLNFTCFEMIDVEQQPHAKCSPEGLLRQIVFAARKASIPLAGENALPRFDDIAHKQIIKSSKLLPDDSSSEEVFEPMCSFTFLRMSEQLFHSENWHRFVQFVRQMAEGRSFQPWEEKHHNTESHFDATKSVQEAATAMMCQ